MSKKLISHKVISIFLTLIIIAFSAPFAFAATQVELTSSNITAWPTATYINGEAMYFGQKVGDAVTLSGGTVEYNGAVITGHFEFIDPNSIPTLKGLQRADIKFVPDDTSSFVGFEAKRCRNVTYTVSETIPVYVDEATDPLVATEVEAGALLSTSVLSGGKMTNPYNSEEPKILAGAWKWSPSLNEPSTTVVNESGYYTAQFKVSGYKMVTTQVYVKVAADIPLSTIETYPSVNLTYDPDITWGDVVLEGGKAVIKDTTTEVSGTFSFSESIKNDTPRVGTYEMPIKFTPDDETVALPVEFNCPVTVNKAVPTFKTDDESGIPTITMPYGTKLDSSLDAVIKPLVDVDVPVYLAYKDMNGEDLSYSGTAPLVGTHEIEVRVNIDDSNYETFTMLTFKLEITGFTANCIMEPVGNQGYKIYDTRIKYDGTKPKGTFTVSYTVDGVKQPDITVKYEELFQVEKSKSGKYEFSVKYNETENDPFEIADITYSTEEKLERYVKIGDSNQKYTYGDKVTAVAPATDPSMPDKPYYGFTGWEVTGNIGLSDEELENAEISFVMPDEDVELNATYEFSLKLFFEWIWQQIVQFFTFIMNACKDLFELAVAA